jgi:hypothetical protein
MFGAEMVSLYVLCLVATTLDNWLVAVTCIDIIVFDDQKY